MQIIRTKQLSYQEFQQIHVLWNTEYPATLQDRLSVILDGVKNFNHYIIENDGEDIIAWAVHFEKDNEVRFSMIVKENHQGKGLGKALINALKDDLKEFYGWVMDHSNNLKANGEKFISPLPFFEKSGFEVLHGNRMDNDLVNAVKIKYPPSRIAS